MPTGSTFAVVAALALAAGAAAAGDTSDFSYTTMCGISGLQLNGGTWFKTRERFKGLIMTDELRRDTSSVFYRQRVDLTQGVRLVAGVDTANGNAVPADGWALVAQHDSPYALGQSEAGIGYDGVPGGGLALELDFRQDAEFDDPNDRHLAWSYSAADALSAMTVEGQYYELPEEMAFSNTKAYWLNVTIPPFSDCVPVVNSNSSSCLVDAQVAIKTHFEDQSEEWVYVNVTLDTAALSLDDVYIGVTAASTDPARQFFKALIADFDTSEGCAELFAMAEDGSCELDQSYNDCDVLHSCSQCYDSDWCCGWSADDETCIGQGDSVIVPETDTFFGDQCASTECAAASDSGNSLWLEVVAWGFIVGLSLLLVGYSALWVYRRHHGRGEQQWLLADDGRRSLLSEMRGSEGGGTSVN